MKKILFGILLVFLLIAVVGCSNTAVQKEAAVEKQMEQVQEARQVQVDKYAQFDSAIAQAKESLKSQIAKTNTVMLSKGADKGAVGEIKFTVIGIRNDKTDDHNFKVDVTFKEAYDISRNSLGADAKKMNDWKSIKNQYETFIKSGEMGFIVLYWEIGDTIALNMPTKKGSYVYKLDLQYDESENNMDPYVGIKTFTVMVQ